MSILPLILLLVACSATAQSSDQVRTIAVTGTVETKVAPDMVVWHIRFSDADKALSKAKSASDANVKAIIALREKLGIEEGDLQTSTINIRKEYNEDERGRRMGFKQFRVYRSVTIRQRDLKRLDEFIDTFVASADMEVSFSYQYSKIHETRAETRLKALKVAKEKAGKLAEVCDAKLGKVLTISEHGSGSRSQFQSQLSNNNYIEFGQQPGADQSSTTFIPGAIDVKMTVYATFELE